MVAVVVATEITLQPALGEWEEIVVRVVVRAAVVVVRRFLRPDECALAWLIPDGEARRGCNGRGTGAWGL